MWTGRESVYKERFQDELGIFFTKEEFPELAEETDDVSGVLQKAIGKLVKEQCYGILYIPEGIYPLKHTVRIPPAVRLIGYGETRPVFVLPEDAKGFDGPEPSAQEFAQESYLEGYPGANYMLWFIGERDFEKEEPRDANAGTFYSALSNIDFRIEGKHKGAICIRAHFAQHGFISHCHFDLGDGLSGLFDVGNEMEDLTFEGGDYGIVCRMTSPGWPFAMLDCRFDAQKKAAILTSTTGFTGFRLHISNTPKAFDIYRPGAWEKLYLEDCLLENINGEAISFYCEDSVIQQTNLKNIYCHDVPVLVKRKESGKVYAVQERDYMVEDYTFGYVYSDMEEQAQHREIKTLKPLQERPVLPPSDIPALPPMTQWVSVKKYGAVGDGETDDTKALQAAIDREPILYLPQGIYRVTDTLKLHKDITLIGMSPITTQLILLDDEEAFESFGTPKPLVETAQGGRVVFNGIGIDTAGKNPRAVGIKWMADETSYMNDVKFMGGHGLMYRDGRNAFATLYNPSRTADYDPDRLWDHQYSSLWITSGGGGIFKDLWSASPYAEAGIAITDTVTPGKMYAISLEHHVRKEIKLHRVENWKLYALQTEEEKAEGMECLPMELVSCKNVEIVNYFLFRVVAVNRTYDYGIKLWDCENILFRNLHNKAQMQYTFTVSLKDENTGFFAKSPEYARLTVTGEAPLQEQKTVEGFTVLAEGFNFAQGATLDGEGNLYWCDKVSKTIYRYDKRSKKVIPLLDIHFSPAALALDSEGRLLVAVDYMELKKTVPGQPFQTHDWSNYHPFFSWFYKRGERVYAVDIAAPYNSMQILQKMDAAAVKPEWIVRPAELDYPGMFEQCIHEPIKAYYLAPDKKTALEATLDLARSLRLQTLEEGGEALVTDDANRKTYCYEVTSSGNYTNPKVVASKGQYGAWRGSKDVVFVVDDNLYGYIDGELVVSRSVPEDAYGIVGSGNEFYLLGRHRIYG